MKIIAIYNNLSPTVIMILVKNFDLHSLPYADNFPFDMRSNACLSYFRQTNASQTTGSYILPYSHETHIDRSLRVIFG